MGTYTITIQDRMKQEICELAKKQGNSMCSVIRLAVWEHLEKNRCIDDRPTIT